MRPRLLAMAALFFVVFSTPAHALLCSAGISDLSFGDVDVLSGAPSDITASVSISCTGVSLSIVRVCINLNSGSGGADGSGRYLITGGQSLRYQIYSDALRSSVLGSPSWAFGGNPLTVDVGLNVGGSGSTTATIYGRVFSGQSTIPPGTYNSSFSGAQLSLPYLTLSLFSCSNILSQSPLFSTTLFAVSARVVPNCIVTTQNLNFGTQGDLSVNVDANADLSVTCTSGTTYSVALGNGNTGTGPSARKMTKSAESITYGLYRDASRTQAWGTSAGVDTADNTGTGLVQTYRVYGRVPPQATPSNGTYGDLIAVTINY